MTNDEAMTIVARLASAWPQVELTEPTVEVWREHLMDKRAPIALEVVRGLEQSSKWFPTLAEFTEGYVIAARHDAQERRGFALGGGTQAIVPQEELRRLIESLAKPKTHRHHQGAENCPTCGPVIREEPGNHIRAGDPEHGGPENCPECQKEMAERSRSV